MSRALLILALVALTGCSDPETLAERTAKAHTVCREAGLEAKEGYNFLGAMVVYCTNQPQPARSER